MEKNVRGQIQTGELSPGDIHDNLLDSFDRYQKVERYWSSKSGTWTLLNEGYEEDWDTVKKKDRIRIFREILEKGEGSIFAAFDDGKFIGFAVLLNEKFGSVKQYVQMKYLHVSNGYRHCGTGKRLFRLCVERAKELGAQKIYISANDSEDTQRFYLNLGCADAEEINAECAEAEPYDRQMEYPV